MVYLYINLIDSIVTINRVIAVSVVKFNPHRPVLSYLVIIPRAVLLI